MRFGAIAVVLALSVFAIAAGQAQADPIVAAAGDIACDPTSRFFGGAADPGRCHDRNTADLVNDSGANAVLALGDEQYCCGSLEQFTASYDSTWGRFKAITHPAAGNHEYGAPGATGYFDYFNGSGNFSGPAGDRDKGYYSFDVGRWHLVALNSNCASIAAGPAPDGCGAGSPQEQWLRTDLAAHPAACTLAFWHHPRFSSGGNSRFMGAIWNDLYAAGAELVLSGHQHLYERFPAFNANGTPDPARGVRQLVVGTGGVSLAGSLPVASGEVRQNDTFGVLELALHASSYLWQFVPEAGKTFTDSGLGLCHGAASGVQVPLPLGTGALSVGASGTPVSSGVVGAVKCTVVGSPLDDVLVGTPGNDVICGLGGNDRIDGRGGDDVIVAGPGNDRISSGNGEQRIFGNTGDDSIDAGSGSDRLDGGPGRDRLSGGSGSDRLDGGPGPDLLDGGSGDDSLKGGSGPDVLNGRSGDDRLDGGSGADRLRDDRGRDRLKGAGGNDRLNTLDGRGRDGVNGGRGNDTAVVDRRDRVRSVERVDVRRAGRR